MRADGEGFLRPVVDAAKCVNCGACERACPVLREHAAGEVRAVYAAKATDDALRLACSSGAVFPLVARQVLSEGGVVFGARWADARTVVHGKAEDEAALRELFGSKYLQSVMGNAYADCRAELRKGRKVLFTGTPCQIAGLKGFLGGDDDNLVTRRSSAMRCPRRGSGGGMSIFASVSTAFASGRRIFGTRRTVGRCTTTRSTAVRCARTGS